MFIEKVIGLDLGTNSIGWAIVCRNDDLSYTLLDKGVNIFQDGVAHDKSGEKPAVQERTAARASRRHYFRRRLRKIQLLKILVGQRMCPYISNEDLDNWKLHKKYPVSDDLMAWQRTDDACGKNPYYDRYRCLTEIVLTVMLWGGRCTIFHKEGAFSATEKNQRKNLTVRLKQEYKTFPMLLKMQVVNIWESTSIKFMVAGRKSVTDIHHG